MFASLTRYFVFLLLAISLWLRPYPALAQQRIHLDIRPVTDNVFLLTGSGGNLGLLLGQDGWLMIDSQFAAQSEAIRSELDRFSKAPVKFLVNTHWHQDHTDGNLYFAHAGATILSAPTTRKRLSAEQFVRAFQKKVPPLAEAARPDVVIKDEVTLFINHEEVLIKHLPGAHTDGDLIVWFKKANVVHLGDIYFAGQFPFIDRSSGGSVSGMIAAIEWSLNHLPADVRIIPGHGPLSDTAELQDYLTMLRQSKDLIQKLTQQRQSLATIKSQHPLAALAAKWGNGFIKQDAFVEMLFDELAR